MELLLFTTSVFFAWTGLWKPYLLLISPIYFLSKQAGLTLQIRHSSRFNYVLVMIMLGIIFYALNNLSLGEGLGLLPFALLAEFSLLPLAIWGIYELVYLIFLTLRRR
jgi:hypothetical protein